MVYLASVLVVKIVDGYAKPPPVYDDAAAQQTGTQAPPVNAASIEEWEKANEALYGKIYLSTVDAARAYVYEHAQKPGKRANGQAARNMLVAKDENDSTSHRLTIDDKLNALKIGEHEDPDIFTGEVKRLVEGLTDLGQPVDNKKMGVVLREYSQMFLM